MSQKAHSHLKKAKLPDIIQRGHHHCNKDKHDRSRWIDDRKAIRLYSGLPIVRMPPMKSDIWVQAIGHDFPPRREEEKDMNQDCFYL
ncbi:hypothetical protein A0U92_13510 [Acetobacter aceti]|uniref:Uncharacterized protein n=1 Tax=Acetobacter aceti TaxID=435 RepID=A0A1U9KII0_ACEAC|nr:hypothetical protein A0U92_13510 [Acetobacter aceti]